MRQHRTRPRAAVLGLALSVTAGLMVAGPAQAKKGGNKATESKGNVVIADRAVGATQAAVTSVRLNVGKRFRGKVVEKVKLTYAVNGAAAGSPNQLSFSLTSPTGRKIFVPSPSVGMLTTFGPLTITPDSSRGVCTTAQQTCADPEDNLGPPYWGKIGDLSLTLFYGARMRGTWLFKAYDFDPGFTNVLDRVKLQVSAVKPTR